jgi:hypothetical protein
MAQAVRRRPVIAVTSVQSQSLCTWDVLDKMALGQIFLLVLRVFPRHYQSATASCSVIYVSPTLYRLSVLQRL